MITVSEKAQAHLKSIADANEGKFPRLGVKGGGCAGFSYDWQLLTPEEFNSDDEVIDLDNGGKLVVEGMSMMYLFGTMLELKQDLFGTTLEIVNPAAQSSCGCGESINFDMDAVAANMDQGFKLPND